MLKSIFDLEMLTSVLTGSVIFSRAEYGVGRNKKYPTKEACLLFGYFLLSPTNLFVAKITRGYSRNPCHESFLPSFFSKKRKSIQTNFSKKSKKVFTKSSKVCIMIK